MIVKAPILAWLFFVLGAGALQPPARASFRRHQDFANSRARSGGPCLTRLSGSEDSNQDGNYDPRFGFGSLGFVLLDALQRGAGRDQVRPGEVAIAGRDAPELGIVLSQSYEVREIYYQGVEGATVKKVQVDRLDAPAPAGCEGFTKYLLLYSPRYHAESGPVCLRPDEVALVTLGDEIASSWVLALPGLLWVAVALAFYQYGVATGRLN
mmetsp:Transcript_22672/g.51164  ORF Transcript_22672/g.51164 Transcript_22672/m.51164 type:complete len:210 (-) Transcript_22672:238-867(-)